MALVGAGPSGAALALLLARAGHTVTVFDRVRFPRDKTCGEGLMPPGVSLLRELGVFDAVMATGARVLEGVTYRRLGETASAYAPFPAPPNGGAAWGLGVRRMHFDAVLVDALRGEPLVTLREGEAVTGLLVDAGGRFSGVRTSEAELRSAVVVAADGVHSRLRVWAGLDAPLHNHGRYGVVGHWRLDTRHVHCITVSFARGHEWYEAPVGPDTLLVSALAERQTLGVIARDYAAHARAALPALRGAELLDRPRAAGRLRQRSRSVAERGLFLLGDAAGYDDPTTGEGLAAGLQLAERLADRLHAHLVGKLSLVEAARCYGRDHSRYWRDRRRLIRVALLMARSPWLSRRALARAAADPSAMSKLLAINCGYLGFRGLSPRDYLALLGM